MIEATDKEIYFAALRYSIKARRDNLRWLMSNVTLDREDAWRDRQFKKLETEIDALVAEYDWAEQEIGGIDA